jgi:DNA-binding XRE family transcriptional regulator
MTTNDLRAYRRIHDLSHLGLADLVGVSPVTVSRWEAGKLPIPDWVSRELGLPGPPVRRVTHY